MYCFISPTNMNDSERDVWRIYGGDEGPPPPKKQKTELNEEAIIETAIAAMDMLEKIKKQLKEQPGTRRQSEKLKNYALSTARCSDEILDHS